MSKNSNLVEVIARLSPRTLLDKILTCVSTLSFRIPVGIARLPKRSCYSRLGARDKTNRSLAFQFVISHLGRSEIDAYGVRGFGSVISASELAAATLTSHAIRQKFHFVSTFALRVTPCGVISKLPVVRYALGAI